MYHQSAHILGYNKDYERCFYATMLYISLNLKIVVKQSIVSITKHIIILEKVNVLFWWQPSSIVVHILNKVIF
jgi:hypothetical protein